MAGTVHPITRYGDTALHSVCAPVTAFDEELAQLIEDMFASMYAANGVGLAANQIGIGRRVFVFDCGEGDQRVVGHVVNPTITLPKGRRHVDVDTEGCLSVPGPYADLARMDEATVSGFDRIGRPMTLTGKGLLARCFQHEVDHLDGIVYVDKLSPRKRRSVLAEAGLT